MTTATSRPAAPKSISRPSNKTGFLTSLANAAAGSRTSGPSPSYVQVVPRSRRRLANRAGNYQGKFSGKNKHKKPSIYEKKGHCSQHQQHGTQEQSDCAWLGMTSVVANEIGYDVGVAVIRYIMNKHYGVQYGNINDDLDPNYRIANIIFVAEEQGHTSAPQNDTSAFTFTNATVNSFAAWFRFVFSSSTFNSYNDNTSNVFHRRYLKGYILTELDEESTSSSVQKELGFQPLDQMYVNAYSTVTMKLQNITEADAAARIFV
jgi:hypothetical protein